MHRPIEVRIAAASQLVLSCRPIVAVASATAMVEWDALALATVDLARVGSDTVIQGFTAAVRRSAFQRVATAEVFHSDSETN